MVRVAGEESSFTAPIPSRIHSSALQPTPSQRATIKYFFVVVALWGVQILMGMLTAHYGVEGNGFYGFPLDRYLALRHHAHLAPAARHLLDRHLVAGDRPLCRPRRQRP